MIFSILPLLLLFLFSLSAYPDTGTDIKSNLKLIFPGLENNEITEIISRGRTDRNPISVSDFRFLPDIPERDQILSDLEKTDFNTATESIFFIPDKGTKAYNRETVIKECFSVLTDIEKMKGITYYSVSHKKERTLFTDAEITSGRIIKPVTTLPEKHSINASIEDTTFGSNNYEMVYYISENYLIMKMDNSERLSLGFIPVAGKGALVFYISVIPAEKGVFLFCSGTSRTVDSEFIRKRVRESVYNRITALFRWFSDNYNGIR